MRKWGTPRNSSCARYAACCHRSYGETPRSIPPMYVLRLLLKALPSATGHGLRPAKKGIFPPLFLHYILRYAFGIYVYMP
jgi:hypothetical protein